MLNLRAKYRIMEIKIEAYQVAEKINIKKLKTEFRAELQSGNISELFYNFEDTRYLYVFDYGVVVFGNYDSVEKSQFLKFLRDFIENPLENDLSESYILQEDAQISKNWVGDDIVKVKSLDASVLKIVMLNVAQSVALEYYENLTSELLDSTKKFVEELSQNGKLSISKKNLMMYIGRTLNVKNSIVDNLYILDDPNAVWDDEMLNHLNRQLKANFDTFARFKDIDYRLQIVENNLRTFTDVLNHRESALLEWIIIGLILFEIVHTLLTTR